MKTMQQIADDLGLARSTVSLCLSDGHQNYRISAATVQRVREYADRIGFVPNRMAGGLGKVSTPPVGLIINQNSSFEKSAVALRYAMQRLHDSKREFVIQGFIGGQLLSTVRMLKGMQIKEIIMFGLLSEVESHNSWERVEFAGAGELSKIAALLKDIKFFSVDYHFPVPPDGIRNIYRMGINRLETMIGLMTRLETAGKGNFMCEIAAHDVEALVARHFIFDRRQILNGDHAPGDSFEVGRSFGETVLREYSHLKVRTVLVRDDRTAVGLIEKLRENHLRVPADIQVIGFDNLIDAPYFQVPLTTIEVPVLSNTKRVLDHILTGVELPRAVETAANIIWRESATL